MNTVNERVVVTKIIDIKGFYFGFQVRSVWGMLLRRLVSVTLRTTVSIISCFLED